MDEIAALKFLIIQKLRESAALSAYVGDRVYDVPPEEPAKMTSPYVSMGPFSSSDDNAECFESYDITGQIDVYSWGAGEALSTMQATKISAIVKDVINGTGEQEQALQGGHVLSYLRFRSKRIITASDGKTKHVPITISAIVDKT